MNGGAVNLNALGFLHNSQVIQLSQLRQMQKNRNATTVALISERM